MWRDSISVETSSSLLRPDPFSQPDWQERCGTSVKVVHRPLRSENSEGRSGHRHHRPGKKHHSSYRFQTGQKGDRHLQENRESGRNPIKTELFTSHSPTPSAGIQPENPTAEKKAKKATRRLHTIGRALVRELVRKTTQKQISPYAQTLLNAWSILLQNKTDKHKIYSLHEPHVSCISKGKAHKPFEFGSKVSISRTRDSGIILGALALPGNPYDGHTVQAALKQIKRIIGKQPEILIADRGYKGQKEFGKTRLLTPSVPLKTDSQYDQRKQRKRFRKRAGLEATISHLKQHFRMGKCYLKGELGDQINVILAAAAYNLRQWIRFRLDPFFVLFLKNLKFRISQHLRLTNPYLRQTFSF